MTRSCALVLGGLAAGGCATYTPRPVVPEEELARLCTARLDDLRIEYAQPTGIAERGPLRFDASDGLDEAELAAVALTIHPALRAKRAEIGEAEALLISAGLLPNPDIGAFLRPGIGGASGTGLGLEALFALLRPDERRAKRGLAEARIEVVRAEIAAQELRLVSDVRLARIAVLSAARAVRLLQQEADLRDDALELVRQQRALGETTDIALALVELERTTVQGQLREAQATVAGERRSLNALLGLPPSLDLHLAGDGLDASFTLVPDVTDEQLDARLLSGHTELRVRAAEYQRSEQDLRLAVARQVPLLSLGPSYERDVEGSQGLGLGAALELPLFDRNQGAIAEQLATRERRRAEYVATLHALRARAFGARAELRRLRAEVEVQQGEVLPLVQRTELLFEAALRARELSIFEWLSARTRSIQARRGLLDALTRYSQAAVELDSATGATFVSVLTEPSDPTSRGDFNEH